MLFYTQNTDIKKNRKNEEGFILLTIPVVIVLFSFFVTAMMAETNPNQFYFETTTQESMTDVKVALASYAHRNYRIPCPADPSANPNIFGSESGLNANNVCARTKGILPFRALGLTEESAKDEWGNFFTYKVSPDFTRQLVTAVDFEQIGSGTEKLLIAASGTANYVHQICRTPDWTTVGQPGYIMSNGGNASITAQNINQNIYKARFCCPSNVSGSGTTTFTAAGNAFQNGAVANLDEDGDGVGDDKVSLLVEGLDTDIALWDESDSVLADRIQDSHIFAQNAVFEYNPGFEHGTAGDGLGPSLGPNNPSMETGKFWRNAAVFDINEEEIVVRDLTLALSDLGENNHHDPVQVSLDVVDDEGTLIDTIAYVIQLPEAPTGVGEVSISLDTITGDSRQEGLFYPTSSTSWPNGSFANGNKSRLSPARAEDLFNASKASLTAKLAAAGLTIDDVQVGRVKMNATHASLAFSEMSFGSPSTSNNTDLIIRNESGAERLTPRNDVNSYQSTDILHDTAVAQDFEAAAYALISHGSDGEGAYLANGTEDQRDNIIDANENPNEVFNHTDLREVRDIRKIISDNSAEKFDDIVLWDSQITLYNSLRNGTCETSQAL